jgi:hypothetical protein
MVRIIVEFERSVAAAEPALLDHDWKKVGALLSDQRRLTHALANALEETQAYRPQAFTDEVNRRIRGISDRREDQLRRLIAFNHLVHSRLTMMARAREMRRGSADVAPPRIVDTLQ